MRWLWLLYRRPRVFQAEAEANGGKWRISAIVLCSALPWIFAVTLASMQIAQPKPWLEAMIAAASFLAWKLTFPLLVAVFAIGIALDGDSWVLFGVTGAVGAWRASLGVWTADPVAKAVLGAVAFGIMINAWLALGRRPIERKAAGHRDNLLLLVIGLAFLPIVYTSRDVLSVALPEVIRNCSLMLPIAARAYYWPLALLFVWPRLRPEWYRWHPVAWDDACFVPYWKLDGLLLAYAEIEPAQALAEMDRIAEVNHVQGRGARRAKERYASGGSGGGSRRMPPVRNNSTPSFESSTQ